MEHYITAGELLLLLGVFWTPIFAVASFVQSRLIVASTVKGTAIWLLAAAILETMLAFAILISPLDRMFVSPSKFPDGLEMGSLPLQVGILSALLITGSVWVLGRALHAIKGHVQDESN